MTRWRHAQPIKRQARADTGWRIHVLAKLREPMHGDERMAATLELKRARAVPRIWKLQRAHGGTGRTGPTIRLNSGWMQQCTWPGWRSPP